MVNKKTRKIPRIRHIIKCLSYRGGLSSLKRKGPRFSCNNQPRSRYRLNAGASNSPTFSFSLIKKDTSKTSGWRNNGKIHCLHARKGRPSLGLLGFVYLISAHRNVFTPSNSLQNPRMHACYLVRSIWDGATPGHRSKRAFHY